MITEAFTFWLYYAKVPAMGIIKDAKAASARTDAARAAQEGRTVFLYRFNIPATSSGISGPVSGAAEVIENIELQGWQLAEMAYDASQSKNGAILLLFRWVPRSPQGPVPGLPEHRAPLPGRLA